MTKQTKINWQRYLAGRVEANMFTSAAQVIDKHSADLEIDPYIGNVIVILSRVFGNCPALAGDMGALVEMITDNLVSQINIPKGCYCGRKGK